MKRVYAKITGQLLTGDVLVEIMEQFRFAQHLSRVVIVSPWITPWRQRPSFSWWIEELKSRRVRTIVVTRRPESKEHLRALMALAEIDRCEVLTNNSVHAKIVACPAPFPWGFGVLGSANLTSGSLGQVEVGLLVQSRMGGDRLVQELALVGEQFLGAHTDSRPFKEQDYRGI